MFKLITFQMYYQLEISASSKLEYFVVNEAITGCFLNELLIAQ